MSYNEPRPPVSNTPLVLGFLVVLAGILLLIVGIAWATPKYNVWRKALNGQATLREAEWSRQVLIQEANAKMESASLLALAEVARAKGVAEANRIIGGSLAGNEAYLRYLWIMGLQDGTSEVIYVPTEAQLPILEAGRFGRDAAVSAP